MLAKSAQPVPNYPLELLDYELPEELIPQQPLPERDASRLLVVHRESKEIEHRRFLELPDILDEEDFLVFNDSRVMRSRFFCTRKGTGGRCEVFLTRIFDGSRAECLTEARGHIQAGEELVLDEQFSFIVETPTTDDSPGQVRILFNGEPAPSQAISQLISSGELPLPPYLKEKLQDEERYQTIFASSLGSSAAPTAALHYTERVLERLKERGISWAFTTLHVGTATFLPIRREDASKHKLSPEYYFIFPGEFRKILRAKLAGKRIVAVGTTVTRLLEWVMKDWEEVCRRESLSSSNLAEISDEELARFFPLSGDTDLYILPGYRFRFIDRLQTNFHLPRTTLLALVYAFGGRELIRKAYDEAVKLRYRFYSLGDAMLIL